MGKANVDLVHVTARFETEVDADEAELTVTVEGSSLVMGNAVFSKAKEVARLVDALQRVGLALDDFQLRDVRAQVQSGILGRSSSATYTLAIRCRELDKLPDVLGEISEAKQATLGAIKWHFPDTAATRAEWLARCVADANVKAHAIAAAIPARILGVHRMSEHDASSPVHYEGETMDGSVPLGGMPRRARTSADVGFPLGQRKKMVTMLLASYRLAPLA